MKLILKLEFDSDNKVSNVSIINTEYDDKDSEVVLEDSVITQPVVVVDEDDKFMDYNNPKRSSLINVVKHFESFYSKAYLDPVNIPTIGYGTIKYSNGKKVSLGETITEPDAIKEMMYELKYMYKQVKPLIKVKLNDNQINAVMSFCYNCGVGNFKTSTLLKRINEKNFNDVPNQFMRWINAGGKPLKGLWRRRLSEAMLFKGITDIPKKAPSNFSQIKYFPSNYKDYI